MRTSSKKTKDQLKKSPVNAEESSHHADSSDSFLMYPTPMVVDSEQSVIRE